MKQNGYALVVLMIAATVMMIALAAALPSVYQEGQRAREEELIFRGNEYAHAIYLFHRQFQRYPASVKELLQTNNLRFLRRAYPDPMSPNGKWRFIHIGAGGALIDSVTQGPGQGPLQGREAGAPSPFGAAGSGGSQFGAAVSPPGEIASPLSGTPVGAPSPTDQSADQNKLKNPPACSGKKSDSSSFFSDEPQGAFIAGVASCSHKDSIRIWNKHTRYDEWEFLGVGFNQFGGVPQAQPPQANLPGQPSQPGQPFSPGQPGPTQPGVQPQPPNQPPLSDQPVPQPPGTTEPVEPPEPPQ